MAGSAEKKDLAGTTVTLLLWLKDMLTSYANMLADKCGRRSRSNDKQDVDVMKILRQKIISEGEKVNEQSLLDFRDAVMSAPNSHNVGTSVKLQLYGWYKQALTGDCSTPAPSAMQMEAHAKWEAWHKCKGSPASFAADQYVETLSDAVPQWRTQTVQKTTKKPADGAGLSFGKSVSTMKNPICEGGKEDISKAGKLNQSIADGKVDAVTSILKKDADLWFRPDKSGMISLHWAADRGQMEIFAVIITAATGRGNLEDHINFKDKNGDTPLHYAAMSEHAEVAKLLVSHGADPDLKNKDGESARDQVDKGNNVWAEIFDASKRKGKKNKKI